MKTYSTKAEIDELQMNLGLNTDGGNFALLGSRRVAFIDKIHDDREEIEQYAVEVFSLKGEAFIAQDIELDNSEEVAVFNKFDDALSYYLGLITAAAKRYLTGE